MNKPNCFYCIFSGKLKDGNMICKVVGGELAKNVFNSDICKDRYNSKLLPIKESKCQ